MARKKNLDNSSEILEFRKDLSEAISRKLRTLELEVEDVKLVKRLIPDMPSDSVIGKIDLTQFDPTNVKKRERIKSRVVSSSVPSESSSVPSEKKTKSDLSFKKLDIECFITVVGAYVDYVRSVSLLCPTLQFAVLKNRIADLNCECCVIKPYEGVVPTLEEMSSFLVSTYICDSIFTRRLLTRLSNRYNSIVVLSAVCDSLKGKDIDENQAKERIREAICRLGKPTAFSEDLGAYIIAMDKSPLYKLSYYIAIAQKVTRASLSSDEFPLMDQLSEDYDIIEEKKEREQNAFDGFLNNAKLKSSFSEREFNAILGHDVENVDDEDQERINDSPITCPKRFVNKPDALRKFYNLILNKEWISVDENSFLYWFNSIKVEKETINRIKWLKNETDLKCFLEALYPNHDYYKSFIPVFVNKRGVEYTNLGGNSLIFRAVESKKKKLQDLQYKGRTGRAAYDSQKAFIDEVKMEIKKALEE